MHKFIEASLGPLYHPALHHLRVNKETKRIQKEIKRRIALNQILAESTGRTPRIYVDVTDVFFEDKGTGIQRVTKEISRYLKDISSEYDVVEVYCKGFGYNDCATKQEINLQKGDVFFILDQSIQNICNNLPLFLYLMENGIKVALFFYDIIPLYYPNLCNPSYAKEFPKFLSKILNLAMIICDSETVAFELKDYLEQNPKIKRNPLLKITASPLGCDFSTKNNQFSSIYKDVTEKNIHSPSFLMVSTVEPRKMYAQAVGAFDLLWKKGLDVNLWIVGRPGWRNEKTISLIEKHPELGKKLLWYKTGISDDELNSLYSKCDAVLFASLAEGFGLAVAEGAHFKKPLILRDIPVFREIAGNNAFYFTGKEPEDLAKKIEEWILLYKTNSAPDSAKITLRTWKDCASQVLAQLIDNTNGDIQK